MRGRYPESSRIVNRGKKIAMGGSITEMTQVRVVYTPSIIREIRVGESGSMFNRSRNLSPKAEKNDERAEDG